MLCHPFFCTARHGGVRTASNIPEFSEAASGASKRLEELEREATVPVSEMENMMSLLFNATHTTAVFTHVLNTNLQEFKRIEAELVLLSRKRAEDSCLKLLVRAPTRIERMQSIVRRLSMLRRHVELFVITAES